MFYLSEKCLFCNVWQLKILVCYNEQNGQRGLKSKVTITLGHEFFLNKSFRNLFLNLLRRL